MKGNSEETRKRAAAAYERYGSWERMRQATASRVVGNGPIDGLSNDSCRAGPKQTKFKEVLTCAVRTLKFGKS